jgi:hypothetical protein
MTGYAVEAKALTEYAKTLADKESHATEIKGLVNQSDVGNESWGVVGNFLKPPYVEMLSELQGLLDNMKNGLHSASDKFSETAEAYTRSDAEGERVFKELIDKVRPTTHRH